VSAQQVVAGVDGIAVSFAALRSAWAYARHPDARMQRPEPRRPAAPAPSATERQDSR
jgi:hypothetical protein